MCRQRHQELPQPRGEGLRSRPAPVHAPQRSGSGSGEELRLIQEGDGLTAALPQAATNQTEIHMRRDVCLPRIRQRIFISCMSAVAAQCAISLAGS